MVSELMKTKPGVAIGKIAEKLESGALVKPPAWAGALKMGPCNERAVLLQTVWFKRAASVLRTFYISEGKPVGVERLRNKYGGRKRHTVGRAHHRKAGGGVIRRVVMQLEAAGFVARAGKNAGRVITAKGKKFVDAALK